ncbi:MAG TPA: hypothetical protein VIU37_04935 [Candidatus Limnocylindrales bacterium]|jgi:hypothetical protein
MASEIDILTAGRLHQAELLEEAALRRLLRTAGPRRDEPVSGGRRLQTLLRRIAGAPSVA